MVNSTMSVGSTRVPRSVPSYAAPLVLARLLRVRRLSQADHLAVLPVRAGLSLFGVSRGTFSAQTLR